MKVIIGVDGSAGSFTAVRFVGRVLSPARDTIVFYYAPPPIDIRSEGELEPQLADRARHAVSQVVFGEAKQRLPEGLRSCVEMVVGDEDPRTGLPAIAKSRGADLVAVGATGLGFIEGLLLGSVGRTVTYASSTPVLIVRPAPEDRSTGPHLNVLFAHDGSPECERAGTLLSKFSWPANSSGKLIRVIESMSAGGKVPDWLMKKARSADTEAMARAWANEHAQERQEVQSKLVAAAQQLPAIFQHEPIVAEGPPTQRIMETIAKEKTDLVVMGSRGLGVVQRLLMGSTTEHLFTYAPCSVLVVRHDENA